MSNLRSSNKEVNIDWSDAVSVEVTARSAPEVVPECGVPV